MLLADFISDMIYPKEEITEEEIRAIKKAQREIANGKIYTLEGIEEERKNRGLQP